MTNIEISADWILDRFTISSYADGNGNIIITADCFSDSHWIDLALDTMAINYKSDLIDDERDLPCLPQTYQFYWEFRLEELQVGCPNFYKKMLALDLQISLGLKN